MNNLITFEDTQIWLKFLINAVSFLFKTYRMVFCYSVIKYRLLLLVSYFLFLLCQLISQTFYFELFLHHFVIVIKFRSFSLQHEPRTMAIFSMIYD